ncbi:MAG: hypothetical protein ACR2FY_18855 [Pirellulaceae bacterium]
MKHKKQIALPLFTLAGGPKNVPLMLEQGGLRYATVFTSEASVGRFQQAGCSLDSYELQSLTTPAEVQSGLQATRKFGCSLILVDPVGPEIERDQSQPLAAFLRQLPQEPMASVRKGK